MAKHDTILARLRKCDRWVEGGRAHGMVILHGISAKNGKMRIEKIDEKILTDLIHQGRVDCDKSERHNYEGTHYHEVQQIYWRVLP